MASAIIVIAVLLVIVVGQDTVLASASTRDVRCGRRLVSGLFSRPRLPLGYSYVTTVPRGACRLNVSEMVPSDNYIALKVTNGSFIMNGEFAVSSPGSYDAVGTRFQYSRIGSLDYVYTNGPLQEPIDIMILYTQPNPSIKYEYLTKSLPEEIDIEPVTKVNVPEETPTISKHMRRHHNYRPYFKDALYPEDSDEDIRDNLLQPRSFMWKILSYSQCTRSCGGGFQLGKYRCVESSPTAIDREVSPVHCIGPSPSSKRRRCGTVQCHPRWQVTSWSTCLKCGPANKTRIIGCVQEHSKGITKTSDHKCPAPKPPNVEPCDIPDCTSQSKQNDIKLKLRPRAHNNIDAFKEGPIYTLNVNGTADIGPEYSYGLAGIWLYNDWSECVGWCVGGGVQTRGVKCADPSGCPSSRALESSKTCTISTCDPYDGQWFTGEWSACSSSCNGKQVRGVLCIGGSGRHLKDTACQAPKPEQERNCGEDCSPTWYTSEWSQCIGPCQSTGVQRRTVTCLSHEGERPSDAECTDQKPSVQRDCYVEECSLRENERKEYGTTETQRIARNEIVLTPIEDQVTRPTKKKDCVDKLSNCALAVQARLCHYNYYILNCCDSCAS